MVRRWTQKRLTTKEEDAAQKTACLTLYRVPFISMSFCPSAGCDIPRPLVFVLVALLPAVHLTQQLPAQPHVAGRPAVETVQGGILEEGAVSMDTSLLSSLPLCGTPSRPAALQQSGSEQL